MDERGLSVDRSTIYRWVQKYAPEMEKRLRGQCRHPQSTSGRVDETYVRVDGGRSQCLQRRKGKFLSGGVTSAPRSVI